MPSISAIPKFERKAFVLSFTSWTTSLPLCMMAFIAPPCVLWRTASSSSTCVASTLADCGIFALPTSFSTRYSTLRPTGSIITAVAVLLTHIEIKPVATINPAISRLGLVPISSTIPRAMRMCKFHFCIARASTKPPINRKIVSLAYGVTALLKVSTPRIGNSTIGSRAVAGKAIASVIHQIPISTATAATMAIPFVFSFFAPAAAWATSPALLGMR